MPTVIDYPSNALHEQFPYLQELPNMVKEIVETLYNKESSYQGSWKKRGGVGAFMMLARKWDRIESMSKDSAYDIFTLLMENEGDIKDDVDDLIAYLLLCRAYQRMRERKQRGTV